MASVNDPRCESTLPLTLSLSDFGIYFYPLAKPRAQYDFFLAIFFLAILPATNGRQAIAPQGQRDPHPPPLGQLPVVAIGPARRRRRGRGSMATSPGLNERPAPHSFTNSL